MPSIWVIARTGASVLSIPQIQILCDYVRKKKHHISYERFIPTIPPN